MVVNILDLITGSRKKRKTLALGVYPDTSLKQARVKRDDARKLIADDIYPNVIKLSNKSLIYFALL
jgi:hypothetical protein